MLRGLAGIGLVFVAACAASPPPAAPIFDDVAAPDASGAAAVSSGGPTFYDAAEAPPEAEIAGAARPPRTSDRGSARHDSNGRKWADASIVSAVDGGLVETDVLRAQRTVHPRIDNCMAHMLRRRPAAQKGTSIFAIAIDARGTVRNVSVAGDDFQDAVYEGCVMKELGTVQWPIPTASGGALVKMSYVIEAEAE